MAAEAATAAAEDVDGSIDAMMVAIQDGIAASPWCSVVLRRGQPDNASVTFSGDDLILDMPKGGGRFTRDRTVARRLVQRGYRADEVVAITEELMAAERVAERVAERAAVDAAIAELGEIDPSAISPAMRKLLDDVADWMAQIISHDGDPEGDVGVTFAHVKRGDALLDRLCAARGIPLHRGDPACANCEGAGCFQCGAA